MRTMGRNLHPGKKLTRLYEELAAGVNGKEYVITRIDWSECIYRRLSNGYDVEIFFGEYTDRKHRPVSVVVWSTSVEVTIVAQMGVPRHAVGDVVEAVAALVGKPRERDIDALKQEIKKDYFLGGYCH